MFFFPRFFVAALVVFIPRSIICWMMGSPTPKTTSETGNKQGQQQQQRHRNNTIEVTVQTTTPAAAGAAIYQMPIQLTDDDDDDYHHPKRKHSKKWPTTTSIEEAMFDLSSLTHYTPVTNQNNNFIHFTPGKPHWLIGHETTTCRIGLRFLLSSENGPKQMVVSPTHTLTATTLLMIPGIFSFKNFNFKNPAR